MKSYFLNTCTRFGLMLVALLWLAACGEGPIVPTPVPTLPADGITVISVDGGRVSFKEPLNGATLTNPVYIHAEVDGLVVEPAGEIHEDAGHLHVLVDTEFVAPGTVIPKDDAHIHWGDGSLNGELILEPGEHHLRLQFADGAHTALEGEQYRDEIIITVTE